ncbi:MAG: hypothetical protein ABFS56_33925 [Pseudomonadota bacterium]
MVQGLPFCAINILTDSKLEMIGFSQDGGETILKEFSAGAGLQPAP